METRGLLIFRKVYLWKGADYQGMLLIKSDFFQEEEFACRGDVETYEGDTSGSRNKIDWFYFFFTAEYQILFAVSNKVTYC